MTLCASPVSEKTSTALGSSIGCLEIKPWKVHRLGNVVIKVLEEEEEGQSHSEVLHYTLREAFKPKKYGIIWELFHSVHLGKNSQIIPYFFFEGSPHHHLYYPCIAGGLDKKAGVRGGAKLWVNFQNKEWGWTSRDVTITIFIIIHVIMGRQSS